MERDHYESELRRLQIELVRLLAHVRGTGERVAVLFEGRDAAGKGGAIFRFRRHLNPRYCRVVALAAPTEQERGQWYFQRYLARLPNRGEIVFFDRSWYNRGVVEPVMGFCTEAQHQLFLRQVVEVERMLIEDGLHLVKLWFSITPEEQKKRLERRMTDELKQWKLSTTDVQAQQKWDAFTAYKERMYLHTHKPGSPWIIVQGQNKLRARLEAIRFVLARFDYEGKGDTGVSLVPDPAFVAPYDGPTTAAGTLLDC